jgi:protein disulfide-isomerase A1
MLYHHTKELASPQRMHDPYNLCLVTPLIHSPCSIVSYMTKQSLPAVSILADEGGLKDFKGADSVVLVGYFDEDDKESNKTFTDAANAMRDNYLFGATNDAGLAKEEGVKQPAIVLYKSFDEGKVVFSEKFEKEAIEAFAKKASTPLVGEVGPDTYQGYMSGRG